MIKNTHAMHNGHHFLNIANLPDVAQQELVTFYEFLIYKYKRQEIPAQSEKQRILSTIFQEADGKLPLNYTFNREEVHEH